MNISEAIEALKHPATEPTTDGRCVSRATWGPGVRFQRHKDGHWALRTVDGIDVPYTPSDEDWEADDWLLGSSQYAATK